MSEKQITCIPRPNCPVCSKFGHPAYTELKDTLFDIPGKWDMSMCIDKECGTYWLNPTPVPAEIVKLYETYTTHSTPTRIISPKQKSVIGSILEKVRSAIFSEYGYKNLSSPSTNFIFQFISKLHPGWRDAQLNQVLYVPFVENGHLLDVGCGNGNAMTRFMNRGWKTTGTDFDPRSIQEAKEKGLDVHLGDIKKIKFSSNSFDVVFLSHVIEHVPDPIETLAECRRILKPEGFLIALTPNANSIGHKEFRQYWRGLEVPRHLQIFTPLSLAEVAKQAGFSKVEGKTCLQGSQYLWDSSKNNKRNSTFELLPTNNRKRLVDQIRLFVTGVKFKFRPGQEETVLLQCQK